MAKQIDLNNAKTLLPKRFADSNKSTYGKILNIAGSKFYQGAAYLSSISALKVGAGYLTLACPDCILGNIASQTPDLTFLPLRSFNNESIASDNAPSLLEKTDSYDTISLGCGLSTNPSTVEFVGKFLQKFDADIPIVIDADGLNAISLLNVTKLPSKTIITPHPKELSRLLEIDVDEINKNREECAIIASKKYNCITVLKGHNTVITDNKENVYINNTGNSGLAKAGTGDILTGIITGLLAQKLPLIEAATLGTFIHGLCADLAKDKYSEYGILASNLLDYLPLALKNILN